MAERVQNGERAPRNPHVAADTHMANIFFVSDTHLGHANILTFTGANGQRIRPFDSVADMDEHIIDRWNAVVRPQDHVYHLGDVTMERGTLTRCLHPHSPLRLVERLCGQKRLVLGNHDHCPVEAYLAVGFQKVYGVKLVDKFWCSHVPIHPTNLGRALGNIHGHIHERSSPVGPYVNVSVEAVNYMPVALEDVYKRLGY